MLAGVWVVGAVAATSIAWSAVGLVGDQVTDGREAPLSADAVQAALGAVTPTPAASPTPTPNPTPSARPSRSSRPSPVQTGSRTYTLTGGTVAVSCTGATIRLVYATPRGGFESTVEDAGPAEVEVRFRSEAHESKLEASCAGGRPIGDPEEKPR